MTEPRTLSHQHRKRAPIHESGDTLDDDLRVIEHLGGSRKVDIYLCCSRGRGELVACKAPRPEYRIDYRSLSAAPPETGMTGTASVPRSPCWDVQSR
jgi:hypothetical protein